MEKEEIVLQALHEASTFVKARQIAECTGLSSAMVGYIFQKYNGVIIEPYTNAGSHTIWRKIPAPA